MTNNTEDEYLYSVATVVIMETILAQGGVLHSIYDPPDRNQQEVITIALRSSLANMGSYSSTACGPLIKIADYRISRLDWGEKLLFMQLLDSLLQTVEHVHSSKPEFPRLLARIVKFVIQRCNKEWGYIRIPRADKTHCIYHSCPMQLGC